MAGINTGPSKGFFGRLGQGFGKMGQNLKKNAPAALNRAGQQFGGPTFSKTAAITSPFLRRPQQPPDQPLPSKRLPGFMGGAPDVQSNPMFGAAPQEGGAGIGGGMVGPPSFMSAPVDPAMGMGAPSMPGGQGGMGGGGLWNAYGNLSAQQNPRRNLFY